jgi:hypothetical protein
MTKTKEQKKGEYCERKVRRELLDECIKVTPLKKGADFLCIKPNGTETLIEAKCNQSQLTVYQKRLKENWENSGKEYNIRRCGCPK